MSVKGAVIHLMDCHDLLTSRGGPEETVEPEKRAPSFGEDQSAVGTPLQMVRDTQTVLQYILTVLASPSLLPSTCEKPRRRPRSVSHIIFALERVRRLFSCCTVHASIPIIASRELACPCSVFQNPAFLLGADTSARTAQAGTDPDGAGQSLVTTG